MTTEQFENTQRHNRGHDLDALGVMGEEIWTEEQEQVSASVCPVAAMPRSVPWLACAAAGLAQLQNSRRTWGWRPELSEKSGARGCIKADGTWLHPEWSVFAWTYFFLIPVFFCFQFVQTTRSMSAPETSPVCGQGH